MNPAQLSKNFTLDEFLFSQTATRHGINMHVALSGPVYSNLRRLCMRLLQPLRDELGPVIVTSGYRPPRLNRMIGGSPTSQHLVGLAADIVVPGYTPLEVAQWIRHNTTVYDQLIHEFGEWVHVSVPARNRAARHQLLTAVRIPSALPWTKPRTRYVDGLVSLETALQRAGHAA